MSDAAALGNVYVLNCNAEEIENLTVAGLVVNKDPVEGWSRGGDGEGPQYTPRGLPVPRAKQAEEVPGKFGLGDQLVRGEWPSEPRKVTVHIPSPRESGVNLTEDMVLVISPYVAILLAPNGHLLDEPKAFQGA